MVPASVRASDYAPDRESDPVFGIAMGLYVALLATPFVVLAVERTVAPGLVTHYVTFLATAAVSMALCWVAVGRRPAVAVRAGATHWALLLPLAGVALAGAGLAAAPSSAVFGLSALFAGGFASLLGVAVAAIATSRHAAAVLAAEPEETVWTAGWPESLKRRVEIAALAVGGVGGAAILATFVAGWSPLWYVGQALVVVAALGSALPRERTYVVTPAGLVIREIGGLARVRSWSAFDGYSVTDAGVRLHRPRRLDYRCAREALDVDAVASALDGHLSRRDAASV